jgi:hypothetical protein
VNGSPPRAEAADDNLGGSAADADAALAARYGRSASGRRRTGIVVIAIVAAALTGWAVWAALGQSGDTVGGLVESYDVRSPHEISVTLQITRTAEGPAQCTVVALASDHAQVGRHVVRLAPATSGTRTITTLVRTEREATTADVTDCR